MLKTGEEDTGEYDVGTNSEQEMEQESPLCFVGKKKVRKNFVF